MTRIALRNYRCFREQDNAVLPLASPFCAIIGANNAGKSSLLKALVELRDVLAQSPEDWSLLLKGSTRGVTFPFVKDPNEVFHNGNDKAITCEIDVPGGVPEWQPNTSLSMTLSRPEHPCSG